MGAYRQQHSSTFNAIMLRESDFTEMALHSLESLWQCLTICIELKTYVKDSLISIELQFVRCCLFGSQTHQV